MPNPNKNRRYCIICINLRVVRKLFAFAIAIYLISLGIGPVFGLHVHHSMHQESLIHDDDRTDEKAKVSPVDHCKQHCQSENLLEHAIENAGNPEKADIDEALLVQPSIVSYSKRPSVFVKAIERTPPAATSTLLHLEFCLQPQAPPVR